VRLDRIRGARTKKAEANGRENCGNGKLRLGNLHHAVLSRTKKGLANRSNAKRVSRCNED
jgi:hypothetical protein